MRPISHKGDDGSYSTYLDICDLYILNAVRCPYVTYVRSSATLGVASTVANDVIMRMTS